VDRRAAAVHDRAPSKERAMDAVQQLERLFAWDEWANREVLQNLEAAPSPSARSIQLLAHVIGAELLWLSRLESRPKPCAVWPDFDLRQCAEHVRQLPRQWQDYFADLAPEDLASSISYVNSKGEKHESHVGDVLMHVALHSSYHRGQIAADVRAGGRDPAYTDFIHCTRMGLV
jgi:uncharacterized damage-inducible protein DinB